MTASEASDMAGETTGSSEPGMPPSDVPPPSGAAALPPSHRWGFGAFLLTELVFLLSSVLITLPFGDLKSNPSLLPVALLTSLAVPTLLAAGVAVLATVVRGNGPVIDLRLRITWPDLRTGLGVGVIGLLVTTVASQAWALWAGRDNANSAVGDLLNGVRLPPVLGVVMFLHLFLVAPLCEEIVFRGVLWGSMERWKWGRWACLAGSTAIFAVAHLEPLRTPLLLVIGVPIGVARMLTGRLPASVVAHSINNFMPAVGMLLMTQGILHS